MEIVRFRWLSVENNFIKKEAQLPDSDHVKVSENASKNSKIGGRIHIMKMCACASAR